MRLLACVTLALCCMMTSAAQNTSTTAAPITPMAVTTEVESACSGGHCGKYVEQYSKYVIPATADGDMQGYVKDVAMDGASIAAAGIVFFVIFLIWGCCMCCRCCPCGDPLDCLNDQKQPSAGSKRKVVFFFVFASLVCMVGVLSQGLVVEKQQSEAIVTFKSKLNNIGEWAGFANNSIGDTVVAVGTISPAVAGMSDAATTFVDKWSAKYTNIDLSAITDTIDSTKEVFINIDKALDGVSSQSDDMLSQANGKIDEVNQPIDDFNEYRGMGMTAVFQLVLVLCLIQFLFSTCDVCCPNGKRPNQKCIITKCATPLTTFIFLIGMLLLFIVGFVLFVTTAIMSDVCVQPDTLILSAEGSSFSTYFIKCDEYTADQKAKAHPLIGEYVQIEGRLNESKGYTTQLTQLIADLKVEDYATVAPPQPPPGAPQQAIDAFDLFVAERDEFVKDFGILKVGMVDGTAKIVGATAEVTQAYKGLQKLFSCDDDYDGDGDGDGINSLYIGLLTATCDEVHTSIATTFILSVALGTVMVLLECLRRCVRAPRFIEHGDDDDFDGASKSGRHSQGGEEYGLKGQKYSETEFGTSESAVP